MTKAHNSYVTHTYTLECWLMYLLQLTPNDLA